MGDGADSHDHRKLAAVALFAHSLLDLTTRTADPGAEVAALLENIHNRVVSHEGGLHAAPDVIRLQADPHPADRSSPAVPVPRQADGLAIQQDALSR